MVGKTLLVTAIASVLAVLLVASIAVAQPIAQAQEEETVLTCILSDDQDQESVVKCIVPPPVEEEPVEEEDAEPYIANTYPMELPVMPESYPVRVYAKIDGIAGGATAPGHEGEIEIRNYFFSAAPGDNLLKDEGEFSEVTILKMSDASTPALITAVGDQTEFDTVLLSVRDTGASADRIQVLLVDTQLKTLRHTSESDDWYYQPGWPWEEMTLSFSKVLVRHQEIDAQGNPVGDPVISGWDITAGKPIHDSAWPNFLTWTDKD